MLVQDPNAATILDIPDGDRGVKRKSEEMGDSGNSA